MRFTNVLAASVVAPLVAAHGGIEGAPRVFGMPKELRARAPLAGHQAPRSLTARQDLRCGPDNGNQKCPSGQCCSSAGYCGNSKDHCQAPDCLIDFSDSCDASYTPVGESTRNDPRPQLGKIPYGGEGIYVCNNPGTVALTYDDGPYIYTDAMLDLFKARGAKATFFVTGNNIGKGAIDENWGPVIKRMIAEGHQVASHTWSHQDLSQISEEQVYDQMVKNEMAIRNIIGKYPTYMRPPYSSCNGVCQNILQKLGYVVSYFDLDTDDYNQLTKEKIEVAKANFKNGIDTRNNDPYDGDRLSIAHDIHELSAVDLTTYMLDYLEQQGLRAVTMGECLQDPEANWYRSSTPGQPRPSSTRSATPSKTPTPPSGPTVDGTCGGDKGYTCAGFLDQDGKSGECCSASGWCGNTADHCAKDSCQPLYGNCGNQVSSSVTPSSSATHVSSTSASAHSPTPTWFSGETSKDGSCGGEKGYTCKGFKTLQGVLSECCSQYGYCGASVEYCGTGCNPLYGDCTGSGSSSVPSSSKHDSTSSSVPSSSKHDSTSSVYSHSASYSASYSASETSKHESSTSARPSATSSGYPENSPSPTDAYPSSSKESYPTSSKEAYPSNSKDSYPTGSKDSYPSNSKDSYPTSSKDTTYPTSSKNTYPSASTSPCSTLKTIVKPSSSPCESSTVKPTPTPYVPVSVDGKCGKDNNGQTCAGYTDPFGNKLECCCAQSGRCSNDPWACSAQGCNKGYGKCKDGY